MRNIDAVDLSFGPEWSILEILGAGNVTIEKQAALARLIRTPNLNWGELLEQALRHKVHCLLADYLFSHNLISAVPGFMDSFLLNMRRFNQYEISLLRKTALEVTQALRKAAIPVAATKGIVFESTLYHGRGARTLSDLDFMIEPQNAECVLHVMNELGFERGDYDPYSGKIVPHKRAEVLIYQLSPDHLPRFVKLTNDPLVPDVAVDFAMTFTWDKSEYQISLEDAFQHLISIPIPGQERELLPTLHPTHHFLFTILHFFREAWFSRHWSESEAKDVNLIKCADINIFWHNHPELQEPDFAELVHRYHLEQPVGWVLEHIDRTFGTTILETIGMKGYVSEDWLASTNTSECSSLYWRGTMRERLHSKERRSLLTSLPKQSEGEKQ